MKLISKLVFSILLLIGANANAKVVEGRLLAKLQGELDPMVLGDGCISAIEYYDDQVNKLINIVILQDESKKCISEDVEANEEIDFNTSKLKLISNKKELNALKDLTKNVLLIKKINNFYRL